MVDLTGPVETFAVVAAHVPEALQSRSMSATRTASGNAGPVMKTLDWETPAQRLEMPRNGNK